MEHDEPGTASEFRSRIEDVQTLLVSALDKFARARATSMISRDVSPIALLTSNTRGEVSSSTTDLSFSSSFDRNRHLKNSLPLCDNSKLRLDTGLSDASVFGLELPTRQDSVFRGSIEDCTEL